jgi:Mn2+/Fe2+ NRAMP family transporter
VVLGLVLLLLVVNTINIAADIAAMGEALVLLVGGLKHEHTLIFAAASVLLQIFVPYHRYASLLKWMTIALFAYVAMIFFIDVPWGDVIFGTLVPTVSFKADYLMLVVAVLGTTISPYLFFWQASQEVEEMHRGRPAKPLKRRKGGRSEITRITRDTMIGMIVSNVVSYSIVLTTAATLHAHGLTNIQTSADAANALRPIAGEFAFVLFAAGIIGTGMLAVPVLAGSAAYAVGDLFGWRSTLEARFPEAFGFYAIISAATLIGFGLTFTAIDPIKMLVWAILVRINDFSILQIVLRIHRYTCSLLRRSSSKGSNPVLRK